MAEFLALRGSSAFSAPRLARLQKSVGDIVSGVSLKAEHWYFLELDAPLNAGEMDRLKDLLGIPATLPASPEGNLLLATRFAPWSRKACAAIAALLRKQ